MQSEYLLEEIEGVQHIERAGKGIAVALEDQTSCVEDVVHGCCRRD